MKNIKTFLIIFLLISIFFPLNLFSVSKVSLIVDTSNYSYTNPEIKFLINIIGENGRPIKELKKDNYNIVLFSKTKENKIDEFDLDLIIPENEGIDILLLIDTSGSMKGKPIIDTKNSIIKFLNNLGSNDRVMLVTFSDEIKLISDFTNDKNLVKESLNQIDRLGDETLLYDSINFALDKIKDLPPKRRAILLITDGKDTKSKIKLEDLINKISLYNIPINIIGLGDVDKNILGRISTLSGGIDLFTSETSKIYELYTRIFNSLKDTYLIKIIDPFPTKKLDLRKVKIDLKISGENLSLEKSFILKPKESYVKSKNLLIILFMFILFLLISILIYYISKIKSISNVSPYI